MRQISLRFEEASLDKSQKLADKNGTSLNAIMRAALDEYLAREDLRADLQGLEERMAKSMTRNHAETARLSDDFQLMFAYLDELARFVFRTSPEVVDVAAATALGEKRHARQIENVTKAYSRSKKRAKVADKLGAGETEGSDE